MTAEKSDTTEDPKLAIADRLRHARKARGYKDAVDFARAVGVEDQTYISHENGQRGLKIPSVLQYCHALKINIAWLLEETGPMDGEPFPEGGTQFAENFNTTVRVPVISWVAAGKFIDAAPESMGFFETDNERDMLPLIHHRRTVFALQVDGTSMNRVAPPGSFIFVDYEDRELIDRKDYVFLLDGAVTFKGYRQKDGRIWLEPKSTEPHDMIVPTDGMRVIGRVVGTYIKS